MRAAERSVGAVVLTFRRPKLAAQVVRSLIDVEGFPPDRVLLVVNGEGGLDDAALEASIQVERLPENVGPAGGFGRGMRAAVERLQTDWVYLCEDDVGLFEIPGPRVANLVDEVERLESEGGGPIGGVVAYGRLMSQRLGTTTLHTVRGAPAGFDEVDLAAWGASLVSRRVIDAGIAPDPRLFFGYEDFDFWCKVRNAGFRLLLDRAAAAAVAPNMARDKVFAGKRPLDTQEPWRAYYVARNQLLLAREHGSPLWSLVHFLKSARRFQLAPSKEARVAIVEGLLDGIRGRRGKSTKWMRLKGEL